MSGASSLAELSPLAGTQPFSGRCFDATPTGLPAHGENRLIGQALPRAAVVVRRGWHGSTAECISGRAFAVAALLMGDYFLPMAERVYGDAAATRDDRNASTLARWIMRERPAEVPVGRLQREVRLPGLRTAGEIHAGASVLVEADWQSAP
jgi:hypothetical protein